MTRRLFLALVGLASAVGGMTAADRKPNVIVIVADDMGYAAAWKAWNAELVDPLWGLPTRKKK